MNVRPRTLFRGKRGNGGWGWVEVGAVGWMRTVGVNFVPLAGPSMTSMTRISRSPVASAAFLPAPRAGARLFGGISEERLSLLMRVVFCRSLVSRREMCGCAG
jgi:hypothetical protein